MKITANALIKIYGEGDASTRALRGVSFEITSGEFIAIMGTSGSGKSTLLHILGAMDKATEGELYWDEVALHTMSMNQLNKFRRDHISFVFQKFALMAEYTVYENVELPLLVKGIKAKQRKKIIQECLEKLGILDIKDKLPGKISGGQQQRCAIARALVSDNELILADEPTGALDRKNGEEVMELLEMCRQQGKTVIVVTHDERIAQRADRIIGIEDGRITNVEETEKGEQKENE